MRGAVHRVEEGGVRTPAASPEASGEARARGPWRGWLTALALLAALSFAPPASAQDVVDWLQAERARTALNEAAERAARIPMQIRPLRLYPQTDPALLRMAARDAERQRRADSLVQAVADSLLREAETLRELDWRKTEPDEQNAFLEEFGETYWKASGGAFTTPVDTMRTLELRARLTQLFGTPTRNAAAAAQERYAGSEHVQFEYWLTVNDSIPMLVMDTNGPLGTGLLVAGPEEQAEHVAHARADLFARLLDASPEVPFLDYYHDFETRRWYRAGFDGVAFFARPVRTPRWARNFVGEKWRIHR